MGSRFGSFLRAITARRDFESGMNEEMRFHVEQYTDDLIRSGISRQEAQRRACVEFGTMSTIQEECREARGVAMFETLSRQIRYAARLFRKTPGFTSTALLTIALCLGANLTIFAVIDSILLRPLPFPSPDRLVMLYNTYPKAGVDRDGSSLTNYYERRGKIAAFQSLSIYRFGTAIVGNPGATNREQISEVSPEFFTTVGVGPAFGRTFREEETSFQTDNVVILSDAFWRQHFQADPHVIGRQIRVDTFPKTVIGVLPPTFRFLSSSAQLYFPLASRLEDRGPLDRHSGGNVIQMVARLREGATLAQAQSEIDAQNRSLEANDPQAKMIADAGFRTIVAPLHADHVATIRPTLLLLQAGVFVLLLIGTVNLANLLLIRANGRAKELAVRQALGAGSWSVFAEVLIDTLLLALCGGLLGLGVAAGGVRLLVTLGTDRLPLGSQIHFDARVGIVALGAALGMGFALALPIVWFHLRGSTASLRAETRGSSSGGKAHMMRQVFVVTQVALAFVLLVGAGLLGLSLKQVMSVWPGFEADHVLTGHVSLVGGKYGSAPSNLSFINKLMEELRRQPGVVSAGVADNIPFSGKSGKSSATVVGYVTKPGEPPRGNYSYSAAGDYFRSMGFTLREGRFLNQGDSYTGHRICVVDEDFARHYWPHSDALGQRLFEGGSARPNSEAFTVVGVVGRVKQAGLSDEVGLGAVYYPYAYRPTNNLFVVVRGNTQPGTLRLALEGSIRRSDADLALHDVQSMDGRISDSLVARRSPALLAALFSAIAVLLTGIGTYGVLSYAVTQRRREIAIRIAIGAQAGQIRSEFFGAAFRLLFVGSVAGAMGAWLIGRAMQGVLFHVPGFSLQALGGAALVMLLVCIAACLLPAYRASRVSPLRALSE